MRTIWLLLCCVVICFGAACTQTASFDNREERGIAANAASKQMIPQMPPPIADCVFCQIVAGTRPSFNPSFKVFEDDVVIAILDANPLMTGHTLVIPKAHYATVMETPPEVLAAVGSRIPAITRAVLAATDTQACHILTNNRPEAMQSVFHLHFHILPRKAGDTFRIPWNAGRLDKDAATTLAENIRAKLAE